LTKKPPSPPEDDAEIWRRVAKTVTPARGRTTVAQDVPRSNGKKETKTRKASPSAPVKPRPAKTAAAPPAPKTGTAGFDRATAGKLKKGKLPLEGRLDLHGMTQAQAQDALTRFIAASARAGKRTVLVITGKGRLSAQGGVLRRMLPLWLEDPALARHVVALTPAAPKDGGTGAFYLRLRKKRDD